jgi:hypothetical protein
VATFVRYPDFMPTARAIVAINVPDNLAARTDPFETVEVTGEGADWTAAKAACLIPEGGLVLSWMQE